MTKVVTQWLDVEVPGGTLHLVGRGDLDAGDLMHGSAGPSEDLGRWELNFGSAWVVLGFTPKRGSSA